MITNKELNLTELNEIISLKRLSTYNNDISLYIWNTKLSENFFLLLQNLEVGLRNSIYNAFSKRYPNKDFFYLYETNLKNRYLSKKEFHSRECWKMLCSVKHKLNKYNIKITDDKIISELNFGFWTKILQDKHYSDIWRKIFYDVFPNKDIDEKIDKTKSELSKSFNELRNYRNRIFHYEPIFNKSPEKYHKDILESIYFISKSLYIITTEFDDFNTIFTSKNDIEIKFNKHKIII
jgi:hypothetical protein